MKQQKLICYDESGFASDNRTEFTQLLSDGWTITRISGVSEQLCWVLLEKEV